MPPGAWGPKSSDPPPPKTLPKENGTSLAQHNRAAGVVADECYPADWPSTAAVERRVLQGERDLGRPPAILFVESTTPAELSALVESPRGADLARASRRASQEPRELKA